MTKDIRAASTLNDAQSEDYPSRVRMLQSRLALRGFAAAIISSSENVRYLSGYTGFTQSPRSMFVPQTGSPVLIVVEDDEALASSLCSFEIQTYALTNNRFERMIETCLALMSNATTGRLIGLEFDTTTVSQFEICGNLLRDFRFSDVTSEVIELRMIKDLFEITSYRRAAQLSARAAHEALALITAGTTETGVKSAIERAIFADGAARWPSVVIESEVNVVSGPKMSRLHAFATGRQMQAGDGAFFIEGVACDGYWANIARTIVTLGGEQPSSLGPLIERAADAQTSAIERLGPGRTLEDARKAADESLARAGLGGRRIYPMFRGLGLSKYERPGLQDVDRPLEPGMCFCVQVYVRADRAIVGQTDSVLISKDAAEVLTSPIV